MLSRRWAGGGEDNIIYQLYNHTCDGTSATCIDTQIKLLSQTFLAEHPKFQIVISYQAQSGNSENAHIIRCCNTASPYHGLHIRHYTNNANGKPYALRAKFVANPSTDYWAKICDLADELVAVNNLTIDFDFTAGSSVDISVANRNSGLPDSSFTLVFAYNFNNTPFVIGGSVTNGTDASGGWKEMWKGTITSLIIRDI